MNISIVNGPNLNLLGKREPKIYGHKKLEDLYAMIQEHGGNLDLNFDFFQSNHEGALIDYMQSIGFSSDGIIFNPGAFSHYSYALHDCVKSIETPVIEVHISNIHSREGFRRQSVIAPACVGQISGFGFYSYILAIHAILDYRKNTL